MLVVAEIEDEILLNDDILRKDPKGPMDILNTEKVMVFKGSRYHYIQLESRSRKSRY